MSDDRSSEIRRGVDEPDATRTPAPTREAIPVESADSAPGAAPADGDRTVISKRPPASPPTFRRAANPFEMARELEDERLGHFQLEEFIGGGGMGAVFRATDTMLGRTVAVKVVSRDQTNEDALRRFRNEAQSAARLDHPNIARVYYVGEDKGWNYIVFEYIEGVNVRDLVEHNGPLSLEDTISYTLQIAEALEHASQRDVTHRDIKPSNILIMLDGRAKLVDMGLARLQQVESSTDDLTASGVTLGTFDYISPEQARDPRNTDVRSDLYSLGCTLYFMLTGQPPFPDGTVLQKLLSHSSDEPPDLRQHRPDVHESIGAIVKKLLAKQPDQRFQTPRELIGELLMMAERLDMPTIRAQGAVWLPPSPPRTSGWMWHVPWLAALVLLALTVLAISWLDSRTPVAVPGPPYLATRWESPAPATDERESSKPPAGPSTAPESPPVPSAEQGTPADTAAETSDSTTSGKPAPRPSPATTPNGDDVPAKKPAVASETPKPSVTTETTTGNAAASQGAPPPKDTRPAEPAAEPAPLAKPSADATGPSVPPAQPAPAVTAETAQRIVVTDQPLTDPSVVVVDSLEAALQRATLLDKRVEIELRFNDLKLLSPVVVDTAQYRENRLLIRAADGYAPLLAFQPASRPEDVTTTAMIDVLGGHVTWHGVHFFLQVPPSAGRRGSYALLRLDTTEFTEFRQCTFTVRNLPAPNINAAPRTSFIEVVGPGDFNRILFDSQPLEEDVPTIWLKDCIARGQATFVRAEFAIPFWLLWEHGLFVSSERLLEMGGTIYEPKWRDGAVNVSLSRLLAVTEQGISLARSDSVSPYQLGVSVESEDCLFVTKATTPPTPLHLIQTSSVRLADPISLTLRGNHNYYKNTQVVLRVENNSDRALVEQYSFDDLATPDTQRWFNEKNPQPASIFAWPSPSQSVDRQGLYDFIPPGIGDGLFTRVLALTPSQLPRLPDIPPATTAQPAGQSQDAAPSSTSSGAAVDSRTGSVEEAKSATPPGQGQTRPAVP